MCDCLQDLASLRFAARANAALAELLDSDCELKHHANI